PRREVHLAPASRNGGERPFELRDDEGGFAVGPQHEDGRAFERRRVVPAQVGQVGRRADHDGTEPIVRRARGGAGHPFCRALASVHQSFSWICRGTTWNVTGVVPSTEPSATTGSRLGPSIRRVKRARSSLIPGSGTWSPCRNILGKSRYASDFGPVNTSASSTPSPGKDRGDRRKPPSANCPFPTITLQARCRCALPSTTTSSTDRRVPAYAAQNPTNRLPLPIQPGRPAAFAVADACNPTSAMLCA